MDHTMRDHPIETSFEDGMVKLDFKGQISFLKMPPDEARKLSRALNDYADLAEDPLVGLAKSANAALGKPDTVGLALGINEERNTLLIKFTDFVNRMEFTREQGSVLLAGISNLLEKLNGIR